MAVPTLLDTAAPAAMQVRMPATARQRDTLTMTAMADFKQFDIDPHDQYVSTTPPNDIPAPAPNSATTLPGCIRPPSTARCNAMGNEAET